MLTLNDHLAEVGFVMIPHCQVTPPISILHYLEGIHYTAQTSFRFKFFLEISI